ncbi:centromere protein V-like isoform X3 [Sinocyclocheilus grahami]|uniref:centromere protein V-like isoform X3 n=1 Tax=Sinocyclocheilus grahami TaxID=75366 RepID=UPI0007AD156F|nr:PREDICTED: centromere protein V-like isoform X3 [Sinocyclocheilus grahami]
MFYRRALLSSLNRLGRRRQTAGLPYKVRGAKRMAYITKDESCSICTKKQNCHFIVPKSQFTLLQGADNITTYTFNTRMAKHTFCKMCGVQSFYTPRSNPDGFGVAPHCLDPGTVSSVTVEDFCGQNWEESMQKHQTIRSMSKPTTDT